MDSFILSLRRSALVPVIWPASFFWSDVPSSKLCIHSTLPEALPLKLPLHLT